MERLTGRDEKGNLTVEGKEVYAGYLHNAASYLEEYEDALKEDGVSEAFLEDCKRVAQKYKKDNDGWISVEERLPKTNGTYNVTRHIDGHFISDSAYFDGQNTWHSDNRVNHSRPYLTDVIAWRPLPEPYRPERSGNEE